MTRRQLLASVSGVALAALTSATANAFPFRRGGRLRSAEARVTTFTLSEHSATPSKGFKRIGMPFKQADVPPGYRVKIQRDGNVIPAQFDNWTTWTYGNRAGSQQFMTACIRDSDFVASESRTFAVVVEPGPFDNTTSLTMETALSGTDFKVDITSLSGVLTGSQPDQTASLNTHSTVPTRVTKYESGPVCDSWEIWGYFNNPLTGVAHAHLKANWYISVWKNDNGMIAGHEACCVVSQDNWSTPGKEKLIYTATFKNGATVLDTYGGTFNSSLVRGATMEHPYHSQWATVRLADDNEHAARHWVGATRPTITYKPDRTYWIASGMAPPIDLTTNYTMPLTGSTGNFSTNVVYKAGTYQPCSSQGHRSAIDGTGAYPGAEIFTNYSGIAFATQTSVNYRWERVNAFAGMHVPYHRRSVHLRTRPEDKGVADEANTIPAVIMFDERGSSTPPPSYNFTADGMPAPVEAYTYNGFQTDGFVQPTGGYKVGNSTWVPSVDSSHAADFTIFNYLHEGERHMLRVCMDLAVNTVNQKAPTSSGGWAPLMWYNTVAPGTFGEIYPGTPGTLWHGIACRQGQADRIPGRALRMLSNFVLVPDDMVEANYCRKLLDHNIRYMQAHLQYLPAVTNGTWNVFAGGAATSWMIAYNVLNYYTLCDRTGDRRLMPLAEFAAKPCIQYASTNKVGMSQAYQLVGRKDHALIWDATTNPHYPRVYEKITQVEITNNRLYMNTNVSHLWTEGDEVVTGGTDLANGTITFPPELTAGTTYYVVNPDRAVSVQLATTPGGPPINFTQDYTNMSFGVILQSYNNPAKQTGLISAFGDDYSFTNRAAYVMALRHGHPNANVTGLARYDSYFAQLTYSTATWSPWNLSPSV